MGSPISPLFADMVMDDLESDCLRILKDSHNCSFLFYYRYTDDTILCVQKKQIDLIINTFNSYHQNLQFTHELQKNNLINFLDMTLISSDNHIITNWFQKPTASGRFINYFSNHPPQQKKNIVYNLIDRAILLSYESFHRANLKKVEQLLINNEYPYLIIFLKIYKLLLKNYNFTMRRSY